MSSKTERGQSYPIYPHLEMTPVEPNPIYRLADEIVMQGVGELTEYNRGLRSAVRATTVLEPEGGQKGVKDYRRSRALIYFGNTLKALMNTVSTGEYDPYYFAESVNLALGNTAEHKLSVKETDKTPIYIGEDKLGLLRKAQGEDPSLASIIASDPSLMPGRLREQLEAAGAYNDVKKLVPSYRKRTKETQFPKPQRGISEDQRERLSQIDTYLSELDMYMSPQKGVDTNAVPQLTDDEAEKLLRLKKQHDSGKLLS